MIREPDPTLQRDLFALAAARHRRRLRRRRQAVLALPAITLLASLTILLTRPAPGPAWIGSTEPPPPATLTEPLPTKASDPPAASYTTLTSDTELLAALADQGPMIITHPDGRKQLILTRAGR